MDDIEASAPAYPDYTDGPEDNAKPAPFVSTSFDLSILAGGKIDKHLQGPIAAVAERVEGGLDLLQRVVVRDDRRDIDAAFVDPSASKNSRSDPHRQASSTWKMIPAPPAAPSRTCSSFGSGTSIRRILPGA
jgi:hypothetical protein